MQEKAACNVGIYPQKIQAAFSYLAGRQSSESRRLHKQRGRLRSNQGLAMSEERRIKKMRLENQAHF